jgi:CDP-diacylglycerol--serine O-phosphatidyltransferase
VVVRKRRKGIYILPNLFTLAALFGGFYAIVMAMNGRFDLAAVGIFCAMVLDSLDGRVARMTNTQSAFGEQMDSLSDMVLWRRAGADCLRVGAQGAGPLGLDCRLCLLRLCGAAAGALQRQHGGGRQALFQGLPSPAAAALVAGFIWLMTPCWWRTARGRSSRLSMFGDFAWIMFAFTLYAGLTMVTNVPFYSFKDVQMPASVPFAVHRADCAALRSSAIHPPTCCSCLFVGYG